MEEKTARAISFIFHPLFFPFYFTLIILNLNNSITLLMPFNVRIIVLLLILFTTAIIPAIFILLMKRKGFIESLQMESKEERVIPYTITGIFNFSAFYMLKQTPIPEVYYLFLLGSATLILFCLVVNFYIKISAHLAGAGGITGALIGVSLRLNIDLFFLIVLVIFISGVTGFARLKLKAHKPYQIYGSYVAGVIIMIIFLSIGS